MIKLYKPMWKRKSNLEMATFYEELLLDVCTVCGLGLLEDIGPEEKKCNNCHVTSITKSADKCKFENEAVMQ